MIAICIVIFAIVAAVMVYAVLRFRVREDDFEDGPPVHGHTGLEITWTTIPFILVTAIAIVSAIVLSRNDAQAKDTLRIDVDGAAVRVHVQLPRREATPRARCSGCRRAAPSSSTCARST